MWYAWLPLILPVAPLGKRRRRVMLHGAWLRHSAFICEWSILAPDKRLFTNKLRSKRAAHSNHDKTHEERYRDTRDERQHGHRARTSYVVAEAMQIVPAQQPTPTQSSLFSARCTPTSPRLTSRRTRRVRSARIPAGRLRRPIHHHCLWCSHCLQQRLRFRRVVIIDVQLDSVDRLF